VPKVLIVEDNELNRDMLSRRLARRSWDVMIAVDGRQAFEAAVNCAPDLILMDLNLPDMDGWAAATLLKQDQRTAGIPVVALTAHAMVGDREKALRAGCDEFEPKPVEIGRLLGKMETLVQGRHANVEQ
jgi:two-component system, cell cycle response regulator DivK